MYGKNRYGLSLYVNEQKDEEERKKCFIDLLRYLPKYWHSIIEMIELQTALGKEIGELNCYLVDLFKQCFVETATWGLEFWEKELGLDVNLNRSYEYRREIIKAKLRGTATTTKEMIKNVAIAFSGGEVEVIEHNSQYYFEIKFIGIKGIPGNMQAFKKAIEEIKPAHLGVIYSYTYTVWKDVKNFTWGSLKQKNWHNVKVIE